MLKTTLLPVTNALIDDKYSNHEVIGEGSYGLVLKSFDERRTKNVAIKLVSKVNRDSDQAKQCVREICLLHVLQHGNILCLVDTELHNECLNVITDYYDYDLHKLIYEKTSIIMQNSFGDLSRLHLKIFQQLLEAVKYIHAVGVIHRDIKPANVFLDSNFHVKLGDFGFARWISKRQSNFSQYNDADELTEYLVTRWYRAPEVVLNPGRYGKPQDMWSLGCTIAECIRSKVLFPGKESINQLQVIIDVLGKPSNSDLDFDMHHLCRKFIKKLKCKSSGNSLKQSLKGCADIHKDLFPVLSGMLRFNPKARITAADALGLSPFCSQVAVALNGIRSDTSKSPRSLQSTIVKLHALKHVNKVRKSSSPSDLLGFVRAHVDKISNELHDRRLSQAAVSLLNQEDSDDGEDDVISPDESISPGRTLGISQSMSLDLLDEDQNDIDCLSRPTPTSTSPVKSRSSILSALSDTSRVSFRSACRMFTTLSRSSSKSNILNVSSSDDDSIQRAASVMLLASSPTTSHVSLFSGSDPGGQGRENGGSSSTTAPTDNPGRDTRKRKSFLRVLVSSMMTLLRAKREGGRSRSRSVDSQATNDGSDLVVGEQGAMPQSMSGSVCTPTFEPCAVSPTTMSRVAIDMLMSVDPEDYDDEAEPIPARTEEQVFAARPSGMEQSGVRMEHQSGVRMEHQSGVRMERQSGVRMEHQSGVRMEHQSGVRMEYGERRIGQDTAPDEGLTLITSPLPVHLVTKPVGEPADRSDKTPESEQEPLSCTGLNEVRVVELVNDSSYSHVRTEAVWAGVAASFDCESSPVREPGLLPVPVRSLHVNTANPYRPKGTLS